MEDEMQVEEILNNLADVWNKFIKLEKQHPDELRDFTDGIHKCQGIISMRYARAYRPRLFPKK